MKKDEKKTKREVNRVKLVVGLGNFGKEYERTYHNIGFLTVEEVKRDLGATKEKNMCEAKVIEVNVGGQKVLIAQPTTFMNASGRAVRALQSKFGIDAKDMIIVQDDIDIVPGEIRFRDKGSAGTHNGMKSVLALCEGDDFVRVRVGAGKPVLGQDLADYVLSTMPKSSPIFDAIKRAAAAVEDWIGGATLQDLQTKYSK